MLRVARSRDGKRCGATHQRQRTAKRLRRGDQHRPLAEAVPSFSAVYDEHVRWNVGLIYFAQNDVSVPETFRTEARTWGWCRDEFVETARDVALIQHLAANRAVALDDLAARFFAVDPVTGQVNTNPLRACERPMSR